MGSGAGNDRRRSHSLHKQEAAPRQSVGSVAEASGTAACHILLPSDLLNFHSQAAGTRGLCRLHVTEEHKSVSQTEKPLSGWKRNLIDSCWMTPTDLLVPPEGHDEDLYGEESYSCIGGVSTSR